MRLFMIFCVVFLLAGCDTRTSVERAQEDGILIVGNNTEPQSFDPHVATSVSDFKIINAVMEGLLRGDSRKDSVFHPAVAESWMHNPGADVWRFSLRKDAVWSDGTPLTAHDFVYAYHRLLHPEFGGRYADMLYPLKNAEAYNRNFRSLILCGPGSAFAAEYGLDAALLDRVDWKKLDGMDAPELKELAREPSLMEWPAGMPPDAAKRMAAIMLEDVRAGRPDLWYAAHVGARAVDDHTLELAMRSPMPQLPLLLLHCTWFPVPRHAVEAHGGMLSRAGAWTRPGAAVGNGPFVMAEHRFNDYVEVRRNPRYRNAAAVRLNGVRFLPTVNGFTETRMFFNGKMHVTNNVPPEMTAYARERGGADFCQDDYYVTIFYRLNTGHGPLKDARVRKALSMAVDREALVRDVVCGGGQSCFGFTPDGAGYSTPHGVEFNPEKVKEYRLVGYENRLLRAEDFEDDKKDAGEVGAGAVVTAFYELVPADGTAEDSGLRYQQSETVGSPELMYVNLRYKLPDGTESKLMEQGVFADQSPVDDNFCFAAAVAELGMLLNDSEYAGEADLDSVIALARAHLGEDPYGFRHEFVQLVDLYRYIQAQPDKSN